MKTVGVKLFKDHLSRYLQLVKEGETIFVTDREKVIAEIRNPSNKETSSELKMENFLSEQQELGNIVRAKRKKSEINEILKKYSLKTPKLEWKSIYEESRSDRY